MLRLYSNVLESFKFTSRFPPGFLIKEEPLKGFEHLSFPSLKEVHIIGIIYHIESMLCYKNYDPIQLKEAVNEQKVLYIDDYRIMLHKAFPACSIFLFFD